MPPKGTAVSEESREKMRQAKLGKKMSPEFKQKRSEIMKQRWKDPSFKEDMSAKHSGENNVNYGKPMSEEQRQKISEFAKSRTDGHMEKLRQLSIGRVASEETRLKMSAARKGRKFSEEHKQKLREAHLTAENRSKHSAVATSQWNNPTARDGIVAAMKAIKGTPESRQKNKESQHKRWSNYELREKQSCVMRMSWKDPKLLQKQSELTRKRYLDSQWYGTIRYYEGPQYCEKWTEELRERVRAYFGYRCAECGTPQNGSKLHVHHVWYNKRLCCDDTPRTLVPLCSSCHMKTNHNRDYWSEHFQAIVDTYYEGRCWFTKEEFATFQSTPQSLSSC